MQNLVKDKDEYLPKSSEENCIGALICVCVYMLYVCIHARVHVCLGI